MDGRRHVWRVSIQAGPHNPSDLPVLFNSFADEFSPRCKNEIASHSLPCIMELIMIGPHIAACAFESIGLLISVVAKGAGPGGLADVLMALKQAECVGLGKSVNSRQCRE